MTEREGGTRKIDTAVRQIFAKKIAELRNKAGINRAELAEKLGITRASVSAWENGLRFPPADKLIEIADFFNTTTDNLLGRDEVTDARAINRYRFDRAVNRLACIGKVFYRGNGTYVLARPERQLELDFDNGMVKNIDEGLAGIYFESDAALYNFVESIENESLNSDKTFESVLEKRTEGRFVNIELIKAGQVLPTYATNSDL